MDIDLLFVVGLLAVCAIIAACVELILAWDKRNPI